ncbi:MAG: amino acid ABC transporter substrate-binding protein [Spirochaetes bacterium]|nr:amino acid ABC transporter substrate-binding protein [Spirochaetota bacterium]
MKYRRALPVLCWFTFSIASLLPICGCGPSRVKVAVMTKLEAGSIVGSSEINASKLFLDDNNVNNMEIIPLDDGWNPARAVEAYGELEKRGIRILVTSHTSNCALALEKLIQRDHVLTFVTGAATPLLKDKDDYIIRNIQDVGSEQKSIAEYINGLPGDGIIIIRDTDNNAYTGPALDHFKRHLKKQISGIIEISIGKFNIDDINRLIRNRGFGIAYLLIGGYNVASGSIAQAIRSVNPKAPIIFTPWMKTPTLLDTLGDAVNNSVMPSHYPPRKPGGPIDEYFKRFKERFGYSPTYISLNVYTALEILHDAVSAGHRDPDSIRRYIINRKKFKTRFNTIVFDKEGDVNAPLYFITDITKEF